MTTKTFQPAYGTGITLSVGASSAATDIGAGGRQLCITSLNAVQCYLRCGKIGLTATIADYPVPASGQVTISKNPDDTHVAVIAPAGGGSLHIIEGDGF
jgi:hypothetical protein